MTDVSLPVIGQEPWGNDLNAYLTDVDARVTANAGSIGTNTAKIDNNTTLIAQNTAKITSMETQVAGLVSRVDALTTTVTNLVADVSAMFARLGAVEMQANTNAANIDNLGTRVTALEAKPEYVWGSAAYQFAVQMPPSTGSQVRMNNVDPKLATMLDFRRVDADGYDRTQAFALVTPDTLIRLSDSNNGALWYRFKATGAPVKVGTDNFNVPVTYYSSAGTLGGTKVLVGMLIVIPPQSPVEATPLGEPEP